MSINKLDKQKMYDKRWYYSVNYDLIRSRLPTPLLNSLHFSKSDHRDWWNSWYKYWDEAEIVVTGLMISYSHRWWYFSLSDLPILYVLSSLQFIMLLLYLSILQSFLVHVLWIFLWCWLLRAYLVPVPS